MKTLAITKICNCGEKEKLFFTMTQKPDGKGGHYYQSEPMKELSPIVEEQAIVVDACPVCVGNRDLFRERLVKETAAEEIEEFLEIGEMYE